MKFSINYDEIGRGNLWHLTEIYRDFRLIRRSPMPAYEDESSTDSTGIVCALDLNVGSCVFNRRPLQNNRRCN